MPTPFAIVMTTCGDRAEAESIATRLVEGRLAACVQIFPIDSVYRWEGAVERAQEWMLFCKIKAADYTVIAATIRAAHSYSNPEIIEVRIEAGAQAYFDWILSATTR